MKIYFELSLPSRYEYETIYDKVFLKAIFFDLLIEEVVKLMISFFCINKSSHPFGN